jgi:signal transduction histidine kinase
MWLVAVRLLLGAAGLALGAASLSIAQDHPASSFAGRSVGDTIALLAAGWALLAVAALSAHRPGNHIAPLLAGAGGAWFVAEWDNPGVGSSPVFTIGLVLFAASPPLIAWATLAYPSGRLATWDKRTAVGVAFAAVLVVGLLQALFFDPQAQGCAQCPSNLVLVADDPGLVESLNRIGGRVGLGSSLAAIAVAAWALARSSPARRRLVAPVVGAGSVYLGLVAWSFAASLDRGFVGTGDLERRLWLGQAVTLVGLALAIVAGRVQARRMRSSLAGLVVAVGESARSGSLRDALARTLGDDDLDVAYPVGDGRYVDVYGHDVELSADGNRNATPLVQDGRPVAVLIHRRGLLDDADLVDEVASAARLALENERLQAEVRVQEADLRASRARIVEAGDRERQRLERDLHDGAQQRLVGLLLGLRLVRARLGQEVDGRSATRLDEATTELQAAVDDLRELARGLHPAMLSDEGLAAALESLAEGVSAPLRIACVPEARFAPSVENAAYRVVADAAKDGATSVTAVHRNGALVIDIDAPRVPERLVELEDRVGALDGRIRVEGAPGGGVKLRAEIPCG